MNATKQTKRIVLGGEFQLVLMHEHKTAPKPHETAALTALITRGEDVVAGIVGNASNTMFAPAPLAVDVVLSNDGLQFGADIDRIWGWLLFPVSIAPRQIDSIREFLRPRAGIRLVDQSTSVEDPVITDNSLPPLGLGGAGAEPAPQHQVICPVITVIGT